MQQSFDQIYSQCIDPPRNLFNGSRKPLRSHPTYEIVLKQFSEMLSKELMDFLLVKMSMGQLRASFLFTDLMKGINQPIPREVFVIHQHSGNNYSENYGKEEVEYCVQNGLKSTLDFKGDSAFRADRIRNSEWYRTFSIPEDTCITENMKNLSM